ncbi:MAG: glycoside hydrolase family 18 protein [Dehalococcoidia bacterium]
MASDKRGPFDPLLTEAARPPAPDRAVVYVIGTIIGLAILLLVLVLPPISVLSRGGGGSPSVSSSGPGNAATYTSTVRSGMPKLPAGLVAASALFDLAAPSNKRGASRLTVPLKDKQTDQNNLALYTYTAGKWQRLSPASLLAAGSAARGDVNALPGNVAVLRRTKSSLQVAGVIPAGTTVDKAAAPTLTTLHPLTFIPTADGALAGQPPAVPPASYTVVPGVVAPDTAVVDAIMRTAALRQKHATAIADAVKQGNYAGIEVDYRNVSPQLRAEFTDFVSQLATDLHADRRTLTLTLPMPSNKSGSIDPGAYDWAKLGQLADTIEIAGELDQELYFQDTEAALTYITGKVDKTKLLLTISSLSVERGTDGLRAVSLADALTIASQVATDATGDVAPGAHVKLTAQNLAQSAGASGMHWDDAARAVTFSYPGRGGKRTVWIANQFSAAFRLELAQRFGLGGVVISDASVQGGGGDVWPAVAQLADSGSLTLTRPNGALLTPAWEAAGGALDARTGDSVTWTAPARAGSYQVTLIVSDGVVRAGQRIALNVR